VIVTGGGHGLGRSYALACAAEGAAVTVADLDLRAAEGVADEVRQADGEGLAVETDVADIASVRRMASRAAEEFDGIDGLVNNAGMQAFVPMSRVPFDEIPDDEWDRLFAVNVKGVWNACRATVPFLRARGGGSIVNIGSNVTYFASATRAHYVASKSAVVGLTHVLARELGPEFIRANAVAPGSVLSEEQAPPEVVEMRERFAVDQAIPGVLEPADIAGTVVFLLSEASRRVTGQTLVVDAGIVSR
jgi:3-oxoacyl-[acyl-carrier protein] reductase